MDFTRSNNTEPNWPHDVIQAMATNYGRCKGIHRSRCRLIPRVDDSEPECASSEGTSNRTTTDKAFWHFQTVITRPTPWVLYCPAKQIPNIIRPGRALYICQVGTDTNIIPCNMWREPRIQEQTYMSWLSQDTIAKIEERKTIKSRLLQPRQRHRNRQPEGIQRTTEGS